MFKKTILSTALVTAGLLSAGAANAGSPDCVMCAEGGRLDNMYAYETLNFLHHIDRPLVIHDDDGRNTGLKIFGNLGWGIPAGAGDDFHLRWDMTNATFNGMIVQEDFALENGGIILPGNLHVIAQGGEPGGSWVIVGLNALTANAEVDDQWYLDLDSDGAGLRTSANVDGSVRYCIYDEADDALRTVNPLYCAETSLFTQKQGLSVRKTLASYDPIADVQCKRHSRYKGDYHDRPPSYSCFVHKGERNFGALEILTDWAAAQDGEPSDPEDYMWLDGQWSAYWQISGPMDFAQATGDGLQHMDLTPPRSSGCYSSYYGDNGGGEHVYVPLNNDGRPPWDTASVFVRNLQPLDGNEPVGARGDGNWTFCQDDPDHGDHPLIPVLDKYIARLIMPNSWQDTIEEDLNGIDRNGILLRAPILTDFEGADQRVVLVNRGPEPAEYHFEFTVEEKEGVTFTPGPKASGVLNAGETCSLAIGDVVSFEGKPRGSAIIIIAGKSQNIDGAVMLVTDGTAVTTNMTPDEGYNSGLGIISLPPEFED